MDPQPQPAIPLLVLVGPTATGKTALALALAERLRGELPGRPSDAPTLEAVSADSRQIYRLMDIATAKPTPAERARLPHHLLDVVWPDESYTLAQYQADANAAIAEIAGRGALPLLVGGTGLYVRAVVDGLAIPAVAPAPELRAELEAEAAAHGPEALHARLAALDPDAAARIAPRNTRRLIRALEVTLLTGRPFSAQQGRRPTPYRPLLIGLNMDRAALYARAAARIEAMLAAGLVEETRTLVARGYDWTLPAMSSLGYREIGAYLRGELTLEAAVERFALATHAYIRRQLTWFRSDTRIHWLDAAGIHRTPLLPEALAEAALAHIRPWLAG
ncbi:MAG TPA: tRNA (adenosine(37)-N6)-dimethylallyltransferase MiaA [Ktedonobacterales bacterium]|nr:tRNA (adenosine(37)-N6)-dimethylallyltransferase MiaA [Ktedonobacterales bacterium]